MQNKEFKRHIAYEVLTILGTLALLLFVCRLWPILLLVILGIFIAHATALSLCQKSGEYPASASGCSPRTYGSGYPGHGVRLNAAADYRAGHGRFPQRQMGMEDA